MRRAGACDARQALKERGEQGIAPSDFGGQIRALERLVAALGDADWRDRVVFLTR